MEEADLAVEVTVSLVYGRHLDFPFKLCQNRSILCDVFAEEWNVNSLPVQSFIPGSL